MKKGQGKGKEDEMIVDLPRMGAGINSVFNNSPMRIAPVSGRLDVGGKNILRAIKATRSTISAVSKNARPIDIKT